MITEIPKDFTIKGRSSVRRSLRIQRRDDRRRCEELERKALEEIRAQTHVPKRLTKQPIRRSTSNTSASSSSKRKKVYHDLAQMNISSRLLSMPLDMLLYLLEFLGVYYFIFYILCNAFILFYLCSNDFLFLFFLMSSKFRVTIDGK